MKASSPATDSAALWSRAWRRLRRDRLAVVCAVVVLVYAAIAAASALGLLATGWADISTDSWAGPSLAHPLGTTRNGQDVLDRALHSTQTAFSIGLTVAIASTALGAVLGGIAGYASGSLADEVVLWLKGVIDSIPFYLLVAAIAWALK